MMIFWRFIKSVSAGFLALTVFFNSVAFAQSATREEHEKLKKYILTGEVEQCLRLRAIRRTEPLDDYTIIFHMRGGKVYKNSLPHRCFGLGFHRSFSYSVSTGVLCGIDIIHVLEQGSFGAVCGLGDFEEMIKIEEKEDTSS